MNQFGNFVSLIPMILFLSACESTQTIIAPDIIIEDAHGGGSVVEFNLSETLLASGGWEGNIRLWELPSGKKSRAWRAHKNEVTGIKFIHHDSQLVSSGHDGWLKIWTVQGHLLRQHDSLSPIRSMIINENDALIVTGHADGTVRRWQLPELQFIEKKQQHSSPVRAVQYYPPTGLIASSGSRGDTRLWTPGGDSIALPSTPSDIRSLAFIDNGQYLLGGGWFNLYRWELDKASLTVLDTEHHGIIRSIEMLPDNATLASISRQTDSAVLFLDPLSGAVKQRFQSHDMCGADITVSSGQKYLATTSDDASVRIWRLKQSPLMH